MSTTQDYTLNAAPLTSQQLTGRTASHVIRYDGDDWHCELHPQTLAAFLHMRAVALGDGLDLVVQSSFRDFARQAAIWNAKFRGEKTMLDRNGCPLRATDLNPSDRVDAILWWSALPGASRHHWGTDFDLIDRAALTGEWRDYEPQLIPAEFAPGAVFARLNGWLAEHMAEFGFFRPYDHERARGVRPEPWHLSFAPLSVPALTALSESVLRNAISDANIEGSEPVLASLTAIFRDYVCNIDSAG